MTRSSSCIFWGENTNDTNSYVGLSLAADAAGLVSVVGRMTATIEMWPGDGSGTPDVVLLRDQTKVR